MKSKEKPHANICLANYCNFNCYYCQSGGENHSSSKIKNLELKEVKKILDVLEKMGVERIRFTGGEPTLLPYFGEIIDYALNLNFSKIRIATNGFNITKYIKNIKSDKVRVQLSLDTLDKKKFKEITGHDKLDQILEAMRILSENHINTRINIVVMRSNLSEIQNIINYCKTMHFSIKLLGLELLDCFDKQRVLSEMIDFKEQKILLENVGTKYNEIMAPGNLGIPMNEYRNGDINIRVRFFDGWGAKYVESCKRCSIFPCPSGIYGIQILSDGEISLCRFRRGLKFNIFDCKDSDELFQKIENLLFETMGGSKMIKQMEGVTFGTEKFIKIPQDFD